MTALAKLTGVGVGENNDYKGSQLYYESQAVNTIMMVVYLGLVIVLIVMAAKLCFSTACDIRKERINAKRRVYAPIIIITEPSITVSVFDQVI